MGKVMDGYKRCYMRELWMNRPWKYLTDVIRFMKRYPLKKKEHFRIWLRNCFYLNWQCCLVKK